MPKKVVTPSKNATQISIISQEAPLRRPSAVQVRLSLPHTVNVSRLAPMQYGSNPDWLLGVPETEFGFGVRLHMQAHDKTHV